MERGTRGRGRGRGGHNLTPYNQGNWKGSYEEPSNFSRGNTERGRARGRARARGGQTLTLQNQRNWEDNYEELPNFSGGNAEGRGAHGRASIRGGPRGGRGNRRERNSYSGSANSELFDDSVLYEPPEKKFNASDYKYGPPFVGGASRSPTQQFGRTIGPGQHPPSSSFGTYQHQPTQFVDTSLVSPSQTGNQFFLPSPQNTVQWGAPLLVSPQQSHPVFPGSGHNMFVSSPSHMESVARSQPVQVDAQSPPVTDTATAINKLVCVCYC